MKGIYAMNVSFLFENVDHVIAARVLTFHFLSGTIRRKTYNRWVFAGGASAHTRHHEKSRRGKGERMFRNQIFDTLH